MKFQTKLAKSQQSAALMNAVQPEYLATRPSSG
jgi:hypothetical protein